MPPSEQVATEAAKPFESLARLRAEHLNMMRSVRRDRYDQEQVERVRQFVGRIKATGTLIASPAGRDTAQGALDYWNAYLFMAADRAALSAAPPDLDPFDPANAPDLSTMASRIRGWLPSAKRMPDGCSGARRLSRTFSTSCASNRWSSSLGQRAAARAHW